MNAIKKNQKVFFIIVLCTVHLPLIFESFWYDEAALVENAYNVKISDFNNGLNWLQSIPPGYFLISKIILELPFGIYVGRVISLIFLASSAFLVNKYLLPTESRKVTRFLIIGIIMLNSTSLKYGTDFKPYSAEMLFSLLFIVVYKNPSLRKFLLLAVLAPWFGVTTFISGFACIILTIYYSRNIKYIIPFLILTLNVFLVSSLTPLNTQKEFRIAWFGSYEDSFLNSLKSAVGGLLWFPTSGLGWIFDNQLGAHTYAASGLTMLLVCFTIFIFSKNDRKLPVLLICFALITMIHTMRIMPVAGRLFQGLSVLMLVVFFTSIEKFISNGKPRMIVIGLVITICALSLGHKYQHATILNTGLPTNTQQRIFADIDNAPEIKYFVSRQFMKLEPNLITGVTNKKVLTCKEIEFLKGDLVVTSLHTLGEVTDNFGERVFMQVDSRNNGSSVFQVKKAHVSSTTLQIQDKLECKYKFRNAK
jgi:hypothetical protein